LSTAVYAFGDDEAPAARLAAALGVPTWPIGLHTLPDGESLPFAPLAAATALLYRALDRPDGKLMPLLLAADALRRAGAGRVVLVAPYMPYLRQDAVFAPGQPLSRDVLGGVLGAAFDRVVTVEPHLHRTADLTPVFQGTPVASLSAAELLAQRIGRRGAPVIVGPAAESARGGAHRRRPGRPPCGRPQKPPGRPQRAGVPARDGGCGRAAGGHRR
jgi:ribose-phosphate pyrophosphokinase